MCFDIGGVDHLGSSRSPVVDQRPEQIFPNPALCPAHEPIIDRCRWAVLGRTIAPAATAFQHVHDATDDAAIVRSLNASYVRRQVRFDPPPLPIAQPKQVPAHDPDPSQRESGSYCQAGKINEF
jgi:hypothetical protein